MSQGQNQSVGPVSTRGGKLPFSGRRSVWRQKRSLAPIRFLQTPTGYLPLGTWLHAAEDRSRHHAWGGAKARNFAPAGSTTRARRLVRPRGFIEALPFCVRIDVGDPSRLARLGTLQRAAVRDEIPHANLCPSALGGTKTCSGKLERVGRRCLPSSRQQIVSGIRVSGSSKSAFRAHRG